MIGSLLMALAAQAAQADAAPARATNVLPSESAVETRRALHRATQCIARTIPLRVTDALRRDYRDPEYRSAMRELPRDQEECFPTGRMQISNLLLAGGLAEAMIEGGERPLLARLAGAARSAAEPRTATDRIAMCVARSAPNEVAAFFATEPASEDESARRAALQLATDLCSRGGPALQANIEGYRAMLATAAFRLIDRQENPDA